uniref:Serine/threonine-protein kinase 19 n=1 Tax=Zea mays TaxID=4577 RepID=A0A804R6Z6_MAIZE
MTEPSSSYSLPSKKRQRSPDDNEHSLDRGRICLSLDDNLTFNDTMIALQLMRTQFPKLDKVLAQPFILQSQLYSSVKDRTQVDRDLESFKKDKVLRIFKLSSGQDDHAIMFMDDYLKQVSFAIKRSGGKDQDGSEVFEWFERYVVPSKLDVSITQLELCSLLSQGGDVTDKHITLLMNAGLLTRQLIDPNIYWFSIPRIGPILKGLSQGRNEILSLLNRRKYKEMPLSSLENTNIQHDPNSSIVFFILRGWLGLRSTF